MKARDLKSQLQPLLRQSGGEKLQEYLEARRLEAVSSMIHCAPDDIREERGKVIELEAVLKDLFRDEGPKE